jgi:hypothetical protein
MGFLDKMASAVGPLTGGSAVVDIAYPRQPMNHRDWIRVKVYVTSTGGEVKTNGVFVDVMATEEGTVSGWGTCPDCRNQIYTTVQVKNTLVNQAYALSGPFVLPAGGSHEVEGDVQIPQGPSTNRSRQMSHLWYIRGRLDAFGNDPDSGYKEIVVD